MNQIHLLKIYRQPHPLNTLQYYIISHRFTEPHSVSRQQTRLICCRYTGNLTHLIRYNIILYHTESQSLILYQDSKLDSFVADIEGNLTQSIHHSIVKVSNTSHYTEECQNYNYLHERLVVNKRLNSSIYILYSSCVQTFGYDKTHCRLVF